MELVQGDIDELAGTLYEMNTGKIRKRLDTLTSNAKTTAKMLDLTWDGKKDEFTAWLVTWTMLMDKGHQQKESTS